MPWDFPEGQVSGGLLSSCGLLLGLEGIDLADDVVS